MPLRIAIVGCEGDLALASVTPLIARVDSPGLDDYAGVPFLHHCSMCISPEAVCKIKENGLPGIEEVQSSVKGIQAAVLLC